MPDATASELQRYAVSLTPEAKAARAALPVVAELEVYRVLEALADDPDCFGERVQELSPTDRVYRHPDPPIDITYRLHEREPRHIEVRMIALRNTASAVALVAVSYSHADSKWRDELRKFLKPLVRQQRLRLWDDTAIDAGTQWREEIKRAFGAADVAILLVSPDFLASDFIAEQELPLLVEKARRKQGQLLWLAVRPSAFKLHPGLERQQALNDPDHPLSDLRRPACEKELTRVCERILSALVTAKQNAGVQPQAR